MNVSGAIIPYQDSKEVIFGESAASPIKSAQKVLNDSMPVSRMLDPERVSKVLVGTLLATQISSVNAQSGVEGVVVLVGFGSVIVLGVGLFAALGIYSCIQECRSQRRHDDDEPDKSDSFV